MTQDEIIRMAQEAGFPTYSMNSYEKERLADFAALVAAHEREACAKVCEEEAQSWFSGYDEEITSAKMCAAAIRARGKK